MWLCDFGVWFGCCAIGIQLNKYWEGWVDLGIADKFYSIGVNLFGNLYWGAG